MIDDSWVTDAIKQAHACSHLPKAPTPTDDCDYCQYVLALRAHDSHQCLNTGKIESAIASAFYPGSYPFAHGGLARVAGSMCFYIVKAHAFLDGNKRTGSLTAITFLNIHGLDLEYPVDF